MSTLLNLAIHAPSRLKKALPSRAEPSAKNEANIPKSMLEALGNYAILTRIVSHLHSTEMTNLLLTCKAIHDTIQSTATQKQLSMYLCGTWRKMPICLYCLNIGVCQVPHPLRTGNT
jgi:hypothetical protein